MAGFGALGAGPVELAGHCVVIARSGVDRSGLYSRVVLGVGGVPPSEVLSLVLPAVLPGSRGVGVDRCGHCRLGLTGDSVGRHELGDLICRGDRSAVAELRLPGWWGAGGRWTTGGLLMSSHHSGERCLGLLRSWRRGAAAAHRCSGGVGHRS